MGSIRKPDCFLNMDIWITENQGKDQFKISQGQHSKYQTKELSFCPISLQPNVENLTPSSWKDIGTRKFEFEAKTQFLWLK